jgi:copper chaperone
MKKVKLYLDELNCPDCANKIGKVLNKTKGVEKAEVHYTTAKANVEYDEEEIDIEGLKKAVAKTGYQVKRTR